MNSRFVILMLVIISGVLFLSACGGPAEEVVPETSQPAPVPGNNETQPTPYPPSNEVFLPVTGSEPAYPAPEPVMPVNPYPNAQVVEPAPWESVPVTVDPDQVLPFGDLVPAASDQKLATGTVFINGVDLVRVENEPAKLDLVLTGSLPTPCNQLRVVVSEPTNDGEIALKVYSVVDPNVMCIQVMAPFQTSIPLADLTPGAYKVLINEDQVAKFELP